MKHERERERIERLECVCSAVTASSPNTGHAYSSILQGAQLAALRHATAAPPELLPEWSRLLTTNNGARALPPLDGLHGGASPTGACASSVCSAGGSTVRLRASEFRNTG